MTKRRAPAPKKSADAAQRRQAKETYRAEPGSREEAALVGAHAQLRDRPETVPLRIRPRENGEGFEMVADHPEPQLGSLMIMNALGLSSPNELDIISAQLWQVTIRPEADHPLEWELNSALQMLVAIRPQGIVEAMLALQMVAIHNVTITESRFLRHTGHLPARELHGNTLNKLARTFTMQAETLKKLRSTGEQKVVVEHHHKHFHLHQEPDGDKGGEGVQTEIEGQPHERSGMLPAERLAVFGAIEANGMQVPGAGSEGVVRLPVSRSPRRSSKRAP